MARRTVRIEGESSAPNEYCDEFLFDNDSARKLRKLLAVDYQCHVFPKCLTIENGIVLPWIPDVTNANRWGLGGVLDSNGYFVEESGDINYGGKYKYDSSAIRYLEEDVIYLGFMKDHWGVFLADVTRRLYYYFKYGKLKLAIVGFGYEEGSFGRIDKQVNEFLRILEIDRSSIIDVRKPMRFKRIFIPEFGFNFNGKYYSEYLTPFTIASVNTRKLGKTYEKKIYLSRTLFAKNKEVGEKIIEDFFRINGFKIVYPENLSVIEQISIIANAEIVASVEGTIAHNVLFSSSGITQIIIRKQSWLNPRQVIFNQITNTKVIYIDCYKEPFKGYPQNYDEGPFLMLFTKNMLEFARKYNYKIKLRYLLSNIISIVSYSNLCIKRSAWKTYKRVVRIFYPTKKW